MLLDRISCPADLRRLTPDQLDELSAEIREFIVEVVSTSTSGGHLGSNLGAVELTLALHRVFDSPRDILLWDIGHQAYVHKIVTGRLKGFETLKDIRDKGLVYESAAGVDHSTFRAPRDATVSTQVYHDAGRPEDGFCGGFDRSGEALLPRGAGVSGSDLSQPVLPRGPALRQAVRGRTHRRLPGATTSTGADGRAGAVFWG